MGVFQVDKIGDKAQANKKCYQSEPGDKPQGKYGVRDNDLERVSDEFKNIIPGAAFGPVFMPYVCERMASAVPG